MSAWPKYGHRSLEGYRPPHLCSYSWPPCVYGLTPWVVLFSDDLLCLRSWHRTNQWHDSLLPLDSLWLTCWFLLPNLGNRNQQWWSSQRRNVAIRYIYFALGCVIWIWLLHGIFSSLISVSVPRTGKLHRRSAISLWLRSGSSWAECHIRVSDRPTALCDPVSSRGSPTLVHRTRVLNTMLSVSRLTTFQNWSKGGRGRAAQAPTTRKYAAA